MRVVANATRSGEWWAVEVPAVPGLFTQAKRLDQVEAEVIDAAAMLDVEVEAVDVVPALADVDRALIEQAREARNAAVHAEAVAGEASRAAVARLRGDGLTVRDVATVLGLSPQRVSVLARGKVSA